MSEAAGEFSSPTIGTLATSFMFSPSPVIGWGSGAIAVARRPGAVQLAAWAFVAAAAIALASRTTSSGRRLMKASDARFAGNLRQRGVDGSGVEHHVGPREAQHGDPRDGHRVVTAAVGLERGGRQVARRAVDLDREPVARPPEVDVEAEDGPVDARAGEARL